MRTRRGRIRLSSMSSTVVPSMMPSSSSSSRALEEESGDARVVEVGASVVVPVVVSVGVPVVVRAVHVGMAMRAVSMSVCSSHLSLSLCLSLSLSLSSRGHLRRKVLLLLRLVLRIPHLLLLLCRIMLCRVVLRGVLLRVLHVLLLMLVMRVMRVLGVGMGVGRVRGVAERDTPIRRSRRPHIVIIVDIHALRIHRTLALSLPLKHRRMPRVMRVHTSTTTTTRAGTRPKRLPNRQHLLILILLSILSMHTNDRNDLHLPTQHHTEPLPSHRLFHARQARAVPPLVDLAPQSVRFEFHGPEFARGELAVSARCVDVRD